MAGSLEQAKAPSIVDAISAVDTADAAVLLAFRSGGLLDGGGLRECRPIPLPRTAVALQRVRGVLRGIATLDPELNAQEHGKLVRDDGADVSSVNAVIQTNAQGLRTVTWKEPGSC